jgi:hypothetical protein
MKKTLVIASLPVAILAGAGAMSFVRSSGPRLPDRATLTQRQAELGRLANDREMIRVQLDGSSEASLGLLAGYTRQLAQLALNPADTQQHRDLVEGLSRAVENEQAKLHDIQKRRRSELAPLDQRLYALQQQIDEPAIHQCAHTNNPFDSVKISMNPFTANNRRNTPIPNIIALFAALVGLLQVVFVGHSILMSTTAQHWPTTAGTVLDSRVISVDYSGGSPGNRRVQRAEVRYRYEVNGESFESGNLHYRISHIGGDRRFYPPEVAAQYPVGVSIPVSYDPANPSNAVSDTAHASHAYLRFIGGILLLAFGATYLITHPIKTHPAHAHPAIA